MSGGEVPGQLTIHAALGEPDPESRTVRIGQTTRVVRVSAPRWSRTRRHGVCQMCLAAQHQAALHGTPVTELPHRRRVAWVCAVDAEVIPLCVDHAAAAGCSGAAMDRAVRP